MNNDQGFGRVADDGTVYVRTAAGERQVGQWPGGDPEAALAFYRTRYDGLVVEVDLLERRIRAGSVSIEDAATSIARVRASVVNAQAVGDLDALAHRLDALSPLLDERREARKAERAAKLEEAKVAKAKVIDEAEKLAAGTDWRGGSARLQDLLRQWKELPRLDKRTDEALWQRFSAARSAYTRRRRAHFGELSERREAAKSAKEKLIGEAEALSASTDWGATSRAYRDLMTRWKAVGPASKSDDDALWQRFRAAQDAFFTARDAANADLDREYAGNAEVKRQLLGEAERLLPVTDARAAREAFRSIADRWDAAGKVPRTDMKDLEDRFRRVELAVRGAEDATWRRSNPEAHGRASETVAKLEASLAALRAELATAQASGNDRLVQQTQASIEARQSWLDQAAKAVTEFGG